MKRTKKGVTLVELVICCAIIVLVAGAATAVLMSGEHLFSSSANSASNQMELDVLQSHMMNIIPSAKNIGIANDENGDLKLPDSGNCIYLSDNDLIIRIVTGDTEENKIIKETTIRSVADFQYQIILAGIDPNDDTDPDTETTTETSPVTARTQFVYTVTFRDGQTYQGGFVINNLSYSDIFHNGESSNLESALSADNPDRGNLKKYPLYFSIDNASQGTTNPTE